MVKDEDKVRSFLNKLRIQQRHLYIDIVQHKGK